MSCSERRNVPALWQNETGVVYIEFILCFFPLFLVFLGICQLSLITAARLVVGHAASRAARSASVILEEDPALFDEVERGVLSEGEPSPDQEFSKVLSVLGLEGATELGEAPTGVQQGARMRPIRNAAYVPLLSLAPSVILAGDSLLSSVERDWADLSVAVDYLRAATAVTLVEAPRSETLVEEPVGHKALINARVQFVFQCAVPLVRHIMCDWLTVNEKESAGGEGKGWPKRFGSGSNGEDEKGSRRNQRSFFSLPFAENEKFFSSDITDLHRFVILEGTASMPNQGAAYYE